MIVLSARDPQAAEIVASLYQACFQASPILIIAQQPATFILEQANIPFTEWKVSAGAGRNQLPLFFKQLDDFLPTPQNIQWILVGLSGPGWGVDEILTCWGKQKGVPTFALQSWWGDVNTTLNCYPDAFIVRDQTAVALTQKRVGSIPAIPLTPWPFPVISSPPRSTCQQICVQFYAQPVRPDLTCQAVTHLAQSASWPIWVKFHPKTTPVQRARLMKCIKRLQQQGHVIQTGSAGCLCAVQATMFSTMLERLAHQLGHKPTFPMPSLWFIQTTPLIRRLTRRMTHMATLPFKPPIYEVFYNPQKLNQKRNEIRRIVRSHARYEGIRQLSPTKDGLCERLKNSIQQALDAVKPAD